MKGRFLDVGNRGTLPMFLLAPSAARGRMAPGLAWRESWFPTRRYHDWAGPATHFMHDRQAAAPAEAVVLSLHDHVRPDTSCKSLCHKELWNIGEASPGFPARGGQQAPGIAPASSSGPSAGQHGPSIKVYVTGTPGTPGTRRLQSMVRLLRLSILRMSPLRLRLQSPRVFIHLHSAGASAYPRSGIPSTPLIPPPCCVEIPCRTW